MKKHLERFLPQESVIVSAALAFFAANFFTEWYHHFVDASFTSLPELLHGHEVNFHWAVNEALMVLFFAVAAAEVRGSLLPGGPLHGARKAALPLLATVGGVVGPALVYAGLSHLIDSSLSSGWVIPAATDIAFALLVGRFIYGSNAAALTFLLTVAVVDDGIGLGLIPTVYSDGIDFVGLLILLAVVSSIVLILRGFGVRSWIPYVLLGGMTSWIGFLYLEIEAAMGFVPIVVFMPHAHNDSGWFRKEDLERHDTLNRMEHDLKPLLGPILFLFGFVNAGVEVSNIGTATFVVAASLFLGKLVGITLFTRVGMSMGLSLPTGMHFRDVPVVSAIAGIGFTVALFVAGIAFEAVPAVAGAAKIGAFISLPIGFIAAVLFARILRAGRWSEQGVVESAPTLESVHA